MKVLLIDVNCKKSSTGKIVYQIFQNLTKQGYQSTVCYGRGPLIKEKGIYKFGYDFETGIHALMTRITGYTGCFSAFSTKRLLAYIDQFKPDIVHIHELHAYFVNLKPLFYYLAQNSIKTIFTLHCEFDYTGKCGHSLECEKWKGRCQKCPHLRGYPRTVFFDHTKQMHEQKEKLFGMLPNAIITTVSPWLTERAKQSFLCKNTIETIYNGVDTKVFYRRDVQKLRKTLQLDGRKVIVSVASRIMSKEKGGPLIVALASLLREYVFVLVGTDESLIRKENNIIYVPKINDQDELAAYYSLGDIYLLCSEKETFSLTCAEALCCGVPVVGFECGAPETIFTEPYAHFVKYGDLNALVELIRREMTSNSNGIKEYAMNFSLGNMLEEYTKLYNRMMQ